MPLTQDQKKTFKAIGHHLKPVVTIADNGLSDGVLAELERALNDHELIKIQLRILDRDSRQVIIEEICRVCRCEKLQTIGKTALLYRPATKPNRQLSNVLRYQEL